MLSFKSPSPVSLQAQSPRGVSGSRLHPSSVSTPARGSAPHIRCQIYSCMWPETTWRKSHCVSCKDSEMALCGGVRARAPVVPLQARESSNHLMQGDLLLSSHSSKTVKVNLYPRCPPCWSQRDGDLHWADDVQDFVCVGHKYEGVVVHQRSSYRSCQNVWQIRVHEHSYIWRCNAIATFALTHYWLEAVLARDVAPSNWLRKNALFCKACKWQRHGVTTRHS